jgi:methylenetetrahydrofolate reductase (NADPH)
VGTTRTEAAEIISLFQERGISDFLALRGDLPVGESEVPAGSLSHADQLVQLLDSMRGGDSMIAVAAFPNGHPESGKDRQDIDALLSKQEKGADFAISQLFFDTDDFLRFMELARSRGVTIPIVPGIMPIISPKRLERVLELSGERRPEELSRALNNAQSSEERREIGIEWAARQVRELAAAGLDAVHLYAFNEHANVTEVLKRAGVRN